MRKIYFLLTTMLVAVTSWSQNKIWDGPATGGSWATATNWNNNTLPATTDVVEFGVGISGTITNVPNQVIAGLVITGGANITLSKPTAGATNTLSISNGAAANDFIISSGSTLLLGNEINITLGTSAAANIAGAFDLNDRGYNTNGTTVVTTVVSGGSIEANAGGSITNTTIGKLLFQNGSTYIHAMNGGTIPTATWSTSSTCSITGITGTEPGALDQSFGNFTWNCAGQSAELSTATDLTTINGNFTVTNTNNQVLRPSSGSDVTLTIGGNFVINGANAIYVIQDGDNATNNKIFDVNGAFSISAGALRMSSANSVGGTSQMNVAGNFSFTGGTITELGTGTSSIIFDGAGEQVITSGGTIANTVGFTVNSGSVFMMGTSVLGGSNGTFTLSAGAKIVTANNNGLTYTGVAGTSGSIQISGTKSYSSGADYEFRGTSTGVFTTTANPQVRDLGVNNASGNVTLAQAMTVTDSLVLKSGLLITTTNLLTIGATGLTSDATATTFVNGPLAKVGTAAFTFPVGKSGAGYRTIGISAPSVSSTFRAEFFFATPPTGTTGSGLERRSACEYWDLTRSAGTGTASVTVSWQPGSNCSTGQYVTSLASLRVAHLTGGVWINEGQTGNSGTTTAGTVTSNVLSTFSPFSLGSASAIANPLPVLYADVRAFEKNNGVQIEWSNLTERDIANYTIEYSVDGRDFAAISKQLPKNNQNDRADYTDFHASPAAGANFYRVKASEVNGKVIYSKVLRVEKGKSKQGFTLYPNPVTGRQLTLALSGVEEGRYNVRIVSSTGQNVFQKSVVTQGNGVTQTLDLSSTVKPGIYTLFVSGGTYSESKLFVVQ